MVKQTQTIRRQIAKELFQCVFPFCGAGFYSVKIWISAIRILVKILISKSQEVLSKKE